MTPIIEKGEGHMERHHQSTNEHEEHHEAVRELARLVFDLALYVGDLEGVHAPMETPSIGDLIDEARILHNRLEAD